MSGLWFVVAIALLFAVTPGLSEVIEGHEHSCTPLAHHCGCHGTMSAQVTSRDVIIEVTYATNKSAAFAVITEHSRNSEPPPLRPPIA